MVTRPTSPSTHRSRSRSSARTVVAIARVASATDRMRASTAGAPDRGSSDVAGTFTTRIVRLSGRAAPSLAAIDGMRGGMRGPVIGGCVVDGRRDDHRLRDRAVRPLGGLQDELLAGRVVGEVE